MKPTLRPFGSRVLSLLLAAATSAFAQAPAITEGVVAVVNRDVITVGQLREILDEQPNAQEERLSLASLTPESRWLLVSELIDRYLILQEFRNMQMKGTPILQRVVEEGIDGMIRQKFGDDPAALARYLEAHGLTEQHPEPYEGKTLAEVRGEVERELIKENEAKQVQDWLGKLRQKATIKIY